MTQTIEPILDDVIVRLDPEASMPLHQQIFERFRESIRNGQLVPGQRLPPTRRLADHLGVARNTVARAYDDLLGEGYLEGRVGSGTYVALAAGGITTQSELAPLPTTPTSISSWGRRALAVADRGPVAPSQALRYDFHPGTPDWNAFPRQVWARLISRQLRLGGALRRYGDPAGYPSLRQAIAHHLAATRAVACTADQVVIVNGTQQAVDLLARLFVDPGDGIIVEDPGYPEARRTLAAYGARIVFVPVDAAGIRTAALPEGAARAVYVTPTHQFPTGVTMTLERRFQLLAWAERHDALIFEDDYDSQFRYAGSPVESLQGLDRTGRVVYLGTFSTTLFPPLRVGYVVLPPSLIGPFIQAKLLADRGTGTLEQQALADFLGEGHFARHLRRTRRQGRARRDAFVGAIRRHFRGAVDEPVVSTGMHAMLRLPGVDEAAFVAVARDRGVGVYAASQCFAEPPRDHAAVLLGFAAVPEPDIDAGVALLADVYRDLVGRAG